MPDNAMITTIEKAEVTVPAPGAKIYGIRRNPSRGVDMPSATKRQQADIFSEMYRQHPWIRTGIDKIAKVSAAPGIDFIPSDPEEDFIKLHKDNLVKFFRKSHAKKLLRMTYKDLLIYGESFWWIDVTLGGTPTKAKRLHPKFMDAVVDDDELVEWRYGPFHQDADAIFYDKEIILHFSMEDPDSDLVGLSPLISLQETVAQDLFAMRYNRSFFENAAQTGVIFNMRNATKEEVDRNRAWLEANYVGASNAHRPIILEGDIEVDKSVANAQEMEFLGLRKLNRQEIFGVLDVPPDKAGINEDSNRSVAKEADNTFREETISPLQALVEEEVNDVLILELFGYEDILFQHEESGARSKLAQMEIFTAGVDDGLLTRNEVRGELGRGKIKGGDEATVSTSAGIVPLTRLLEQPKPAPQPNPQINPNNVEANGTPGVNPNVPAGDTNGRN